MEETLLKILEQGGGYAIAGLMIWYSWTKDKLHAKNTDLMSQSLKDVADSQKQMAQAFSKIVSEIERSNSNHENIKGVLSSNTKAMGQYYHFVETLIPELKETFGLLKGFLNGLNNVKNAEKN